MKTIIVRFFTFVMKEKTRKFFAFAYYILIIYMFVCNDFLSPLDIICFIIFIFTSILFLPIYGAECLYNIIIKKRGKLGKNIIQELKKISKEILIFIPVSLIPDIIISYMAVMVVGKPANQISIEENFYKTPILIAIIAIIYAPIIEEIIFRFLPSKFINNRIVYIIVSTIIFAAMHVIDDPNPFYYIWYYMVGPVYYGYRYYETKDILVPICMHSLNNLVVTLLMVIS